MEVKLRPLREKEDDAVYQMFQEIPAEEDSSKIRLMDCLRRNLMIFAGVMSVTVRE